MICYIGWFLSLTTPAALLYAVRTAPYPSSLLLAGVIIGIFVGYLIYEHIATHVEISNKKFAEQILLGIFVLLVITTVF